MKFVSPKVDFAFKKIFGSKQSAAILISFLNAIVYGGKNTIKSLTIINPYNPGQISSLKETYLDVKATLFDGTIVVIEMQVGRTTAFSKRILYNLTKAYANQLGVGENYLILKPAISVTIVDFVMFEDSTEVISQFVFKEKNKNREYPDAELQLFFVELPNFKKTLAELSSLTDKWIYFLKETSKLEEVPASLGEVEEIGRALAIANRTSMTLEEIDLVDRRGMILQDEKGRIDYAKEQGRLEGTTALVMRQLQKRFGEIPETISSKIKDLAIEDLESLAEDFLDFDSLEDLSGWLQD
ncbi:MAG: Rpn family recombination-promoting nuclease/putative transposase [Oscillatoria sp. SIO1A7]|nr:Rpn family recombination-promoting nuclease/putative transposase [Oscillatoria sp. SIO1A7]